MESRGDFFIKSGTQTKSTLYIVGEKIGSGDEAKSVVFRKGDFNTLL